MVRMISNELTLISRDVLNVMVIIIRNGICNLSSDLGQNYLYFTSRKA